MPKLATHLGVVIHAKMKSRTSEEWREIRQMVEKPIMAILKEESEHRLTLLDLYAKLRKKIGGNKTGHLQLNDVIETCAKIRELKVEGVPPEEWLNHVPHGREVVAIKEEQPCPSSG